MIYANFAFSLKESPNLIEITLLPLILMTIKSILLVVMVKLLVVCIFDSISQLVNTYPGENAVYKFTEKLIEEGEHCREIIEKNFKAELVINKENERHVELMIFLITSEYKDSNTNFRLTRKIPFIFYNLRVFIS